MAANMPELRAIALNDISHLGPLPVLKIKTDDDVDLWKSKQSYHDYHIFLYRLNEAVVGHYLPWEPEKHSQVF